MKNNRANQKFNHHDELGPFKKVTSSSELSLPNTEFRCG